MPLARRRIGGPGVVGPAPVARAAGTVATVAVVSRGVDRRQDRRDDRRDRRR
jgi:hypothetical protein